MKPPGTYAVVMICVGYFVKPLINFHQLIRGTMLTICSIIPIVKKSPTVRVTTGSIGVLERIKPTASANILPSTNTAFHQILDIQTEIKTIQYNSMRIQFLHLQVQCHRLTMAVSILWI